MERHGDEVHLNETEATGGVKAQGMRYVLGFSLLLVVIAMSAIWILGSVLRLNPDALDAGHAGNACRASPAMGEHRLNWLERLIHWLFLRWFRRQRMDDCRVRFLPIAKS